MTAPSANPFRFNGFSHTLETLPLTFASAPPPRVKLHAPLTQYSAAFGDLTVPAGYVFDGASIPRLVRFWHDPFDPRTLLAAGGHDLRCTAFFYNGRYVHIGSYKDAHEAFAEGCAAGGLEGTRYTLVTEAVIRFGPRWSRRDVIPVADAPEFLRHFPFDWEI